MMIRTYFIAGVFMLVLGISALVQGVLALIYQVPVVRVLRGAESPWQVLIGGVICLVLGNYIVWDTVRRRRRVK